MLLGTGLLSYSYMAEGGTAAGQATIAAAAAAATVEHFYESDVVVAADIHRREDNCLHAPKDNVLRPRFSRSCPCCYLLLVVPLTSRRVFADVDCNAAYAKVKVRGIVSVVCRLPLLVVPFCTKPNGFASPPGFPTSSVVYWPKVTKE